MNRTARLFAAASAAIMVVLSQACTAIQVEQVEVKEPLPEGLYDVTPANDIPVIHAILPGAETRTTLNWEDGVMKSFWKEGDMLCVTPAMGYTSYAALYTLPAGGSSTGDFVRTRSLLASADIYGVYYPGDRVRSHVAYINFSYAGQKQSKSDPMAHLGSYQTMMLTLDSFSTTDGVANLDFSGATMSSCIRINLSGMTFHNPSKITLASSAGAIFYETNYPPGGDYWLGDDGLSPNTVQTNELSMELEGYGDETQLTAYMMMSDTDVKIPANSRIDVSIVCSDGKFQSGISVPSAMTLHGGRCHSLTVDSGWTQGEGDYTVYPDDGEVTVLQEGTADGLDVVIMGDGFIEADMQDGTYDRIMRDAYREFFVPEPLASFKDEFNVYYVKAVSPQRTGAVSTGANGATNTGADTKFSVEFTPYSTTMNGDEEMVREYARKALGADADKRIRNATMIVVANHHTRAGTCHNSWMVPCSTDYGEASAVAYLALGNDTEEFGELVQHEAAGHGFGKLADEYYSNSGKYETLVWSSLDDNHAIGLSRNADKYVDDYIYQQWAQYGYVLTTTGNVYWHDMFNTPNRYEDPEVEGLGAYPGGNARSIDCCRPVEDGSRSIMFGNAGIFNCVCRRQIFYRIRSLDGTVSGKQWAADLPAFLAWDAANFLPKMNEYLRAPSRSAAVSRNNDDRLPLGKPVNEFGHWKDGKFIVSHTDR